MSGLDSLTATAPTEEVLICPSVTGAHVVPPSIVFHNPPPVAPKYASFLRPFTPLTAMERPPRSGPIERHRYALRSVVSIANALAALGSRLSASRPELSARSENAETATKIEVRLVMEGFSE